MPVAALALRLRGLLAAAAGTSAFSPPPRPAPGVVRLVERYGDGPRQHGEWWVPPGPPAGRLPTVVLVHGGYWRPLYDRSLQDAVAADLASRGYLCWNIEYAAADARWPSTLRDVAAGYDHVVRGASADRVDLGRIAVVGHSAGGHLALWLGSRHRVPAELLAGSTSAVPAPALVVAQAPVACLARAAHQRLGAGAVLDLMGGLPEEVPDRYAVADPEVLLPSGARAVLLHARGDDRVPLEQSSAYASAARRAGDDCRLEEVPGGHFEHLDPASAAVDALRRALGLLRG